MATPSSAPVPDPTLPFWRTETSELDCHRSTPDLPEECDILIVGAGYTGAAISHFLYKDNPSPPTVVILEARQACSGATGRNGNNDTDPYPQNQHLIKILSLLQGVI